MVQSLRRRPRRLRPVGRRPHDQQQRLGRLHATKLHCFRRLPATRRDHRTALCKQARRGAVLRVSCGQTPTPASNPGWRALSHETRRKLIFSTVAALSSRSQAAATRRPARLSASPARTRRRTRVFWSAFIIARASRRVMGRLIRSRDRRC